MQSADAEIFAYLGGSLQSLAGLRGLDPGPGAHLFGRIPVPGDSGCANVEGLGRSPYKSTLYINIDNTAVAQG